MGTDMCPDTVCPSPILVTVHQAVTRQRGISGIRFRILSHVFAGSVRMTADAIVVGAGLAGLVATAFELV